MTKVEQIENKVVWIIFILLAVATLIYLGIYTEYIKFPKLKANKISELKQQINDLNSNINELRPRVNTLEGKVNIMGSKLEAFPPCCCKDIESDCDYSVSGTFNLATGNIHITNVSIEQNSSTSVESINDTYIYIPDPLVAGVVTEIKNIATTDKGNSVNITITPIDSYRINVVFCVGDKQIVNIVPIEQGYNIMLDTFEVICQPCTICSDWTINNALTNPSNITSYMGTHGVNIWLQNLTTNIAYQFTFSLAEPPSTFAATPINVWDSTNTIHMIGELRIPNAGGSMYEFDVVFENAKCCGGDTMRLFIPYNGFIDPIPTSYLTCDCTWSVISGNVTLQQVMSPLSTSLIFNNYNIGNSTNNEVLNFTWTVQTGSYPPTSTPITYTTTSTSGKAVTITLMYSSSSDVTICFPTIPLKIQLSNLTLNTSYPNIGTVLCETCQ